MNLRDVRKKIKTVKNVKKITNAMQMVSAVKMKKAQKIALEGRDYRRALDTILQRIITNTPELKDLNIPWLRPTSGSKKLYVIVTSNKGLCGAFHSNLFKFAIQNCDMDSADFVSVGQKGADFIAQFGGNVVADFSEEQPFTENVSPILTLLQDKYMTGEYESVHVVYNAFVSSFKSDPTDTQLFPLEDITALETETVEPDVEANMSAEYIIEPSVDKLLQPLVEDYIRERLRSAISDSEAAEHSARMMAMKTATDNAGELADSLTLLRNKLRQTQITNELLDMIAAMQSTA